MKFHFDFTVTGMTRAEAEALLDFIINESEYYAATVSGGFAEVAEQDDAPEAEPTNDAP